MLNERELAAMFHGLRLIQSDGRIEGCAAGDCEHFDAVEQLSGDEIDALCERLNVPTGSNAAISHGIDLLTGYRKLHDGLSDMIESGRLTEADCPDDYRWLVESLARLGAHPENNKRNMPRLEKEGDN
jgi:hypothetical protein